MHTSSDWVQGQGGRQRGHVAQTRGLSRHYNHPLKWTFKEAASTVIAHSGANPLRRHSDRPLENATKPNLAKLTIARRIAAMVLAMWKAKEKYNPEKVHEPESR